MALLTTLPVISILLSQCQKPMAQKRKLNSIQIQRKECRMNDSSSIRSTLSPRNTVILPSMHSDESLVSQECSHPHENENGDQMTSLEDEKQVHAVQRVGRRSKRVRLLKGFRKQCESQSDSMTTLFCSNVFENLAISGVSSTASSEPSSGVDADLESLTEVLKEPNST